MQAAVPSETLTIYQSTRCLQRVKPGPTQIKRSKRSAAKKLSTLHSSQFLVTVIEFRIAKISSLSVRNGQRPHGTLIYFIHLWPASDNKEYACHPIHTLVTEINPSALCGTQSP